MRRAAVCLLFLVLLFVTAAVSGRVNPFQTRSELLMAAVGQVGVCAPERAAEVWAGGLEQRSAALQYIGMTEALKREYAAMLDTLDSNWVTGLSSPWVESWTLIDLVEPDGNHAEIGLRFQLLTSYSPPEYYDAKLWLVREGDFWRIARIWTDGRLYAYTLYGTPTD